MEPDLKIIHHITCKGTIQFNFLQKKTSEVPRKGISLYPKYCQNKVQ
jgi:hypothetical protein